MKKKVLPQKIKCPDCDAVYHYAKGLSSHRRAAHGYVSQEKAALDVRAAKGDGLKCDKCSFHAKNVPELTWHKAKQHTTHADLQCDQCDFTAKWPGGLTYHKRRSHAEENPTPVAANQRKIARREFAHPAKTQTVVIGRITSNGHQPSQEAHAAPASDPIPEATLAIGLGRFQELSRQLAVEHDLPPRMYASRLAGLIYAATLR